MARGGDTDVATLLDAIEWRHLGPFRGGRVVAVAGDPVDHRVFYFGSTGGGVWKTTDAGCYWRNVSDGYFRRASVGAIAVAPSDRNVVYAGMGEACIRSTVSHGDGVYRSTDGGASWTHCGLAGTRHIGKVRVDPRDPETAFVAAVGHMSGPNAQRGLYRTRDGGRHWTRVLERGARAGAVDVSIDATNPRVVYAATWEAYRHPWIVSSGGRGSGLFRSADGGDAWSDISRSRGFATGILGRVGVAASPARSGRLYAIVEAAVGGVYCSDDHGETWTRGSGDRSLWYRGYYYGHIVADPRDPDTVWVLNQDLWRSVDGGGTFERVSTPHGDEHDLWIDPRDPRRMIVGTDMGAAVTVNGGASWSSLYGQPTAELYHVTTDSRTPYRVYAAQQDCGTVSLPSRSMLSAITNADAIDVGGGESGHVAVRPDDPDIVFAGQFSGYLTRFDARTGQARNIEVWPEPQAWGTGASTVRHRFTWSHPIVLSPHDPSVLYTAGERAFRSTDEGASWEAISPDLTRNEVARMELSGAPISADRPGTERERICTIFTFAESRVRRGVLWAGSDDGRVHLSRDDARTWTDVTPRQVRPWTLVSVVEPSPHDDAVAYVAATRYLLDDFRPMLFRTKDHGRTWRSIVAGISPDEFTRVIREDPVRRGLLFAGTEAGVYVSFDDGARWHAWRADRPVVPVHDLAIKEDDLIAATHGRGFWVVDDISALRGAFPPRATALFAPGPVTRFPTGGRYRKPPVGAHNHSMEGFGSVTWTPLVRPGLRAEHYHDAARNPPDGAVVRYYLRRDVGSDVVLSFHDRRGREIRRFSSSDEDEPRPARTAGLHRFIWDLRYPGPTPVDGGPGDRRGDRPIRGPFVAPGRYTVRLAAGGVRRSASFDVAADPRAGATQADLEAQLALLLRLRDATDEAHRIADDVRAATRRLDALEGIAADRGRPREAAALARARARLAPLEAEVVPPRSGAASDALISPPALAAKLTGLAAKVGSADAAPTKASVELAAILVPQADELGARLRAELATLSGVEASLAPRRPVARSAKGATRRRRRV